MLDPAGCEAKNTRTCLKLLSHLIRVNLKISAIIAFFKFTFKGQIMNKKSFKSTFQPLEIAFKKALGIRKIRNGKIFNESDLH